MVLLDWPESVQHWMTLESTTELVTIAVSLSSEQTKLFKGSDSFSFRKKKFDKCAMVPLLERLPMELALISALMGPNSL